MILNIDNSAINVQACDRRFELTVIRGLRGGPSLSLESGNVFHKSLEYLDKGMPAEEVVAKVFQDAPTVDKIKLLKILIATKMGPRFPPALVINSTPMIEYKFSIPYHKTYQLCNNDTLIINLTGTIDRVHIYPDTDILEVLDYKTSAGTTDHFVNKARREYEMSFQLAFYLYALYNGILPAEYKSYITARRYRLQILIAFYNLTSNQIKIVPRNSYPEEFLLQEIPRIIELRIEQAARIINSMIADPGTRGAMTGLNIYGYCNTCPFRNPCLVAYTEREAELLARYETIPYDPLTFR